MAPAIKQEKLSIVMGILCFLLLNYPLLHIFNRDTFFLGAPLLYGAIFVVWFLAIMGLYAMSRRLASPGAPGKGEPQGHDQ
jgi:hypothetical protein